MKRILTIVSDPLTFGRGHLTRQKRLAQILSDTGFEVTLIVNGDSLTTEKSHDLLILDLSDRDTSPPEKLLGDFKFVVGFDWCMRFVPDINFVVFQHVGKVYPSKIETYVGFEYIILNNRFEQSHRLNSPSAKKYQLISIGFSAKSQKILEVLDVATKISDLPIKICSGIELDLIHKESVELLINPDNYVHLVQDSQVVYTNGASTLLEAMLLRKKIVAFPQTVEEEFFLAEIENRLGVDFRPSSRSQEFLEYDPTRIFDCNGALRILDLLKGYLL